MLGHMQTDEMNMLAAQGVGMIGSSMSGQGGAAGAVGDAANMAATVYQVSKMMDLRQQVRQRSGIKGDGCNDCCTMVRVNHRN
jgi:hypothetical protein